MHSVWIFRSLIRIRALAASLFDERGQDLVEYAVVASLISLAAVVAMSSVATAISAAYTQISNTFASYTT